MPSRIVIAVKNHSTVVPDEDVRGSLPAFQTQVSRDFAKYWGVDAKLQCVPKNKAAPAKAWLLGVFDNADQAGALGYHDLTRTGMPLGKVFAKTTMTYGDKWTVTFSHELLEMLADPNINLCAFDEKARRLYAYEVCDAVEDDSLGYRIDGGPGAYSARPPVGSRRERRRTPKQQWMRSTAS